MATATTIRATIGSDIRIRLVDLDPVVAEQIRSYLTIANQPKVVALERGNWSARDMPDSFSLWRYIGEDLVVPRGTASILRGGLERFGVEIEWADQTSSVPVPLLELASMTTISLRPEQEQAAQELIRQRQGVLQADTGAGKTVIGLEVFRRVGLQCVVLVNSIGLAEQWRARSRQHLGVETGLVGDQVWDERPLTIAVLQTLIRLSDEELAGFFARRGMTIFDEAHHITAETFRRVVELCSTSMLIGKTATPLEGDWRRPILEAMIGPVIHRVRSDTTKPDVLIVRTGFSWRPTGQEAKLVDSRAIYKHLIKALENDPDRVSLIARMIIAQPQESAQLVVCKRLEYLDKIKSELELGGYEGEILFYRGARHGDDRDQVVRRAGDGACVILATVADEGTDIPRLDRIHLTWPARKADSIIQQVGRILRRHDDKLHPLVVDYVDSDNGMLRAQAYSRMNNVYRKKGWNVRHAS